MSLAACAQIVERGDPDRFLATMAAPPKMREMLFPLYAFNVEVARAPWVVQEPMIGAIRLQWWWDALDEIASGKPARAHEVTTPLAACLDPEGARLLQRGVEARHWDLDRAPFADEHAFWAHLDATAADLLWTAARLAGASSPHEPSIRALGRAQGLANWLQAVPALQAKGCMPLADPSDDAIQSLATNAFSALTSVPVKGLAKSALYATWMARVLLRQAQKHPERVMQGGLGLSPFATRARLLAVSSGFIAL